MSLEASPSFGFHRLPTELIDTICCRLPNRDIKNLRLTCRFLGQKALPRLNRVFISPNPRNIQVVRAVADHETFRRGVAEIIWDDTALKFHDEEGLLTQNKRSSKWSRATRRSKKISLLRIRQDYNRPDIVAKLEEFKNHDLSESFTYYKQLLQEQKEVLTASADEDAFRYALGRFPNLRKVTVSPGAHGSLLEPLYETPMIRAFPYGFIYPITRGWPYPEQLYGDVATKAPALDANYGAVNQWRGFRIATRILAHEKNHVSELDFGNNKFRTGINHRIFDEPNEQYDDLCSILESPGFRRLDLSLLAGYLWDSDAKGWDTYRNGNLYDLLAKAPNMQHMELQTDFPVDDTSWSAGVNCSVSLFSMFPIDKWSKLRHFGLSGMQVSQDDLVSFLDRLPSTLHSVELSFLAFIHGQGNHAGLLSDIREKLDWRNRSVDDRVRIRMLIREDNQGHECRYICLDKEIREYIYGDGPPPLDVNEQGTSYRCIEYGTGIRQDDLNPYYERPYNSIDELKRLGYETRRPWEGSNSSGT